jgi:hypothetical protein
MKSTIIKMGLSLATISILFSGCGGSILPPKQISITKQSKEKILLVKATDLNGKKIEEKIVLNSIGYQFSKGSGYKQAKRDYRGAAGSSIYHINGVASAYSKQHLELSYANGKGSDSMEYAAKDIFKFPVTSNLDVATNTYKIIVDYPNEITTNSATIPLDGVATQLDILPNLEKDAKKAFDNLSNLKIKFSLPITGEINTPYSVEATYANFERILRLHNTLRATNGYFLFKLDDGTEVSTHMTVYPYQNGSKVVYDLSVNYSIDMNGGMSITSSDIENIKTKIAKIANN